MDLYTNHRKNEYQLLVNFFSYIAASIVFARKCLKEKNKYITITNGNLTIPRFIFPDKFIKLSDIKSIENHLNSRRIIAISLGFHSSNAIIISKDLFEDLDEFELFVKYITNSLHTGLTEKPSPEITSLIKKSESYRHLPTGVLSVIFFLTYIYCSDSSFGTIKYYIEYRGGLSKEILSRREIYRLASSFFLHMTPMHLGFNVLAFAIFGRYVDIIFGSTKFFNILFLSALSGSILSLMFSSYDLVVGASGGICGLMGAYFVGWKKYKKFLPGSVYLTDRTMYALLILQIIIDVNIPRIDILSHIGGFFCGLLYASWSIRGHSASQAFGSSARERFIAKILFLSYIIGLFYFLAFDLYST